MDYKFLEKNPKKVYSRSDLIQKGVTKELVEKLSDDKFQNHPRMGNGYLGMLVLNYLQREGVVDSKIFIPAYDVSEALDKDLEALLGAKDKERSLVQEKDDDLYISVADVHFFSEGFHNKDDVTELASLYYRTRDIKVRDRAVQMVQKKIKAIALKAFHGFNQIRPLEDFMADANYGLIDALEKFDPNTEGVTTFWTYANTRINGTILDTMRELDPIGRHYRTIIKSVEKFKKEYFNNKLRDPSDKEIEEHVVDEGYDWEKIRTMVLNIPKSNTVSLNDTFENDDGDDPIEGLEMIADPKSDLDKQFMNQELVKMFKQDLEEFDGRKKEIIKEYILDQQTLKDIGIKYDLSEARTSQIVSSCLNNSTYFRRVREYFGKRKPIKIDIKL